VLELYKYTVWSIDNIFSQIQIIAVCSRHRPASLSRTTTLDVALRVTRSNPASEFSFKLLKAGGLVHFLLCSSSVPYSLPCCHGLDGQSSAEPAAKKGLPMYQMSPMATNSFKTRLGGSGTEEPPSRVYAYWYTFFCQT
jgi:hypothetical protein